MATWNYLAKDDVLDRLNQVRQKVYTECGVLADVMPSTYGHLPAI